MSGTPVLSVITASHNRRDLLLRKLDSLVAQELQPGLFEWIVCLDGSTDGSLHALQEALRHSPPAFHVGITSTERRGPGPARNAAVAQASGRILCFSDDDCMLESGTLKAHLGAQLEPAIYVGAIHFDVGGRLRKWLPPDPKWWNINGANISVPAEAFVRVGGFPDYLEGYGGEDLGLGYLLVKDGLEVRRLADASVTHIGEATSDRGDPERWRQAGANAARMAARHPGMATRLGVAGWQLGFKRITVPLLGGRGRWEQAYTEGALAERRRLRAAGKEQG